LRLDGRGENNASPDYRSVVGLSLDPGTIRSYAEAGVEFIALDRPMRHGTSLWVHSDNRAGGRLAVRHLLELGHRRIAHISGPAFLPQSRDRRRGYLDALSEAGLSQDDSLVLESEFSEEPGAAAYLDLDSRRTVCTAVFAGDDVIAIGAMSAAVMTGRTVPDDLSIVGFDDVLPTRYTTPALTTVRQDAVTMGAQAVRAITSPKSTRRPPRMVLPVSLVVRGSTAAPAKRSVHTRRSTAWSE
jgi:DNA-binding LacI/PurR family transcriptional regulator